MSLSIEAGSSISSSSGINNNILNEYQVHLPLFLTLPPVELAAQSFRIYCLVKNVVAENKECIS